MTYNLELMREKFKDLFEYSLDLIYVHDFRGKFLDANKITLEKLGYNREEINNLSFNDLISKDQLTVAFKALTEIRDFGRQITPTEYKLKKKNGDFIYVETYGIPLKEDGKIWGILGVARDITELRLTEQKLKESEERYRYLFDELPSPVFILDKRGKIFDCNSTTEKIFGYKKDELIGESYLKLHEISADYLPILKKRQEMLQKGETPEPLELQGYKKDGGRVWVNVQTSIVKIGKKTFYQTITQDITERKIAEQKLKESEEKYRAVAEQANDGIAIIQNEVFKYVNPSLCEMTGYTREELIDTSHKIIVHPEVIDEVSNRHKRRMMGEDVLKKYDTLLISKDGKKIDVSVNVSIIIYNGEPANLTILHNITERKKMEEKLKTSEEKYRSILKNIKEAYYDVDLIGNLTFFNDSLCNILGYSRDELVGMNYQKFFAEGYVKKAFKSFNSVYRTEKMQKVIDCKIIRKNGTKRDIQFSVSLKQDSKNKKIGFFGIIRDVTERKKMEVLKEKFTEQLEMEVEIKTKELQEICAQQKLYLEQIVKASQFKTEFMGSMSHELRTPLNAIIGFTDLLLESSYGPVNEDQFDFLKDIKSSGEHLLHLIDQILNISKIEAGELFLRFQEIHLKSHIAQIKSSIQPIYEKKKLEFEIIGLDTDKFIYADPIRLKEIFYNLLINAIKFTKKGKITLKILEKEDQWEFQVIDTGIGIAKEDFDIIFKEFKRVESPEVIAILGSGLGLPITRKLVYMHGGTIDFTSEVGKGSTFVFTIPKSLDQKNQE